MSDLEMFLSMLNNAQVSYRVVYRGKDSSHEKTYAYVELPSGYSDVVYFAFTKEGKLSYWGADES